MNLAEQLEKINKENNKSRVEASNKIMKASEYHVVLCVVSSIFAVIFAYLGEFIFCLLALSFSVFLFAMSIVYYRLSKLVSKWVEICKL